MTNVFSHSHPETNQSLTQRDYLYRQLARNLPNAAVFILDPQLTIQLAEGQALSQSQNTSAMLEGRSIVEVLGDMPELLMQFRLTLEGNTIQREYNADTAPYTIQSSPIKAENGTIEFLMLVVTYRDFHQDQGKALLESEQRQGALINALPDAMFVLNRQGIITEYYNGRAQDYFSLHDMVGKHISDTNTPADIMKKALDALESAFITGKVQAYEYEVTFNNDIYYYEARTVVVNENEALTLVRDISRRHRAERILARRNEELEILSQFDQELNNKLSVDYVLQRAIDSTLRLTNATVAYIALYENEKLVPKTWLGNIGLEDIRRSLKNKNARLSQATATGDVVEISDVRSETAYIPVSRATESAIITPLHSLERLIGVLVLESSKARSLAPNAAEIVQWMANRIATGLENSQLHAKTELQLEQLKALYDKVIKLEQMKTDMIRIASHDLKNPLAGIMGYLEMLKWDISHLLDETHKQYIEQIEDAAHRMQRIASGILSLERIEQMAENQTNELLNLSLIAQQIMDEQRGNTDTKKQTLTLETQSDSATMVGDRYQIYEAMSNLVSNAIKYTPEGGMIRLIVRRLDERVEFLVIDNGYGVPDSMKARLFTPFFRAKTKETAYIEGTGIGLHLVKNIVERHEGVMIFESTYREGSTFGFSVPHRST